MVDISYGTFMQVQRLLDEMKYFFPKYLEVDRQNLFLGYELFFIYFFITTHQISSNWGLGSSFVNKPNIESAMPYTNQVNLKF